MCCLPLTFTMFALAMSVINTSDLPPSRLLSFQDFADDAQQGKSELGSIRLPVQIWGGINTLECSYGDIDRYQDWMIESVKVVNSPILHDPMHGRTWVGKAKEWGVGSLFQMLYGPSVTRHHQSLYLMARSNFDQITLRVEKGLGNISPSGSKIQITVLHRGDPLHWISPRDVARRTILEPGQQQSVGDFVKWIKGIIEKPNLRIGSLSPPPPGWRISATQASSEVASVSENTGLSGSRMLTIERDPEFGPVYRGLTPMKYESSCQHFVEFVERKYFHIETNERCCCICCCCIGCCCL